MMEIVRDSETGISSKMSKIGIVAVFVLILFFGFQFIVGTSAAVLAFLLGASYRLYNKVLHEPRESVERRRVRLLHQVLSENVKKLSDRGRQQHDVGAEDSTCTNKSGPEQQHSVKSPRSKMDMRLTGSAIIDETIHEMVDYIMRDYVHSWYDYVSEDDEFIHELRKTMQETLVILSSRVKEIDWIPFLTTQLVDDAASHLRLYRSALTKTKENPQLDLISVFFDFEAAMEKNLCRDMVCTDDTHLQDYLQGLSEALLYLLLPQDTYNCTPIGALAQDLLVSYVLQPLLQLFSDPDVVNQHIIWLCQSFPVTPDILVTAVRMCDNIDEISAVHYFFAQQVADTKDALENTKLTEEKAAYREQYKALTIIKKIIDQKLSRLKEGNPGDWTDDGDQWQNYFMTPGMKLYSLTLEEVLKNSVALSYFIDYMNSVNGNHYILMYLNADAWKSSAEQQLLMIESTNSKSSKLGAEQIENNQAIFQCIKDAAVNVYDQFLGEKATPRVKLPENIVKRFYIQVRTEQTISLTLFDEIQESLIEVMQTTEKFFPSFLRHKLYVKCLMEIDLLKAESVNTNVSDDDEDEVSGENYEDTQTVPHAQGLSSSSVDCSSDATCKDDYQMCRDCLKQREIRMGSFTPQEELSWEKHLLLKKYKLNAEIIEAGLASEKGKQYGVYALQVTRVDDYDKKEKTWHLYRRYSDFYDFHQWIKSKWSMINRIEFPGKHTFRTTERMFLEKRKIALNKYLCSVLTMTVDPCFGESIQDTLLHFLEPGNYVIKKKQFSEKIDTIVNPLKQSVRSVTDVVKSVPDTFINTVDGFTKIFHSKTTVTAGFIEANKVGASIDEDHSFVNGRSFRSQVEEPVATEKDCGDHPTSFEGKE
ncbi:unnamed protein product [Allacma fusca]|uniref:Sorting nexin-13 n=1 Tax=Allacma fusca TaxID=39272 RepID=A0A8J2LUV9_9HEXA|nr:unnamed protein product [Allacma fusca]